MANINRSSSWFPPFSVISMGLITGILIALLTLWLQADTIEKTLLQQSRYQLFQKQLPAVHIQMDGRNIHLTGSVNDEQTLNNIVNAVEQLPGVQTLTHALNITPEKKPSIQWGQTAQPPNDHPLTQLDLSGLDFPYSSTQLSPNSTTTLEQLAAELRQHPNTLVEIAVHSANTGVIAGQIQLTQLRAQAIVDYLIDQDIPAKQLIAHGYGATRSLKEATPQKNFIELNILQE